MPAAQHPKGRAFTQIATPQTGTRLAPFYAWPVRIGEPLPTSTQIRVCQIDACSEVVPIALAPQGICLIHYLEEAFTRVDSALTFCQSGGMPDSSTLDWLLLQGDFAVALLSKKDGVRSSDQRGRLLELLLCLANVRECLRQRAASNA